MFFGTKNQATYAVAKQQRKSRLLLTKGKDFLRADHWDKLRVVADQKQEGIFSLDAERSDPDHRLGKPFLCAGNRSLH